MVTEATTRNLEEAIADLESEHAIVLCTALLSSGVTADRLLDSVARAMEIVGKRYQEGAYFLPELIASGELAEELLKIVHKHHRGIEQRPKAKVLLATVQGDLHDIGKNIFGMFLRSNGFKVYDLGIDVPPRKIVETVEEQKPRILGLSSLLTTSALEVNKVVEALEKSGLRNGLKIIIGGAGINEEVGRKSRIDGYARTAIEGLNICKEWLEMRCSG